MGQNNFNIKIQKIIDERIWQNLVLFSVIEVELHRIFFAATFC